MEKLSFKFGKLSTGKQRRLNFDLFAEIFNLFSFCNAKETSVFEGNFLSISYNTVAEVVVLPSFSILKSDISSRNKRSKSVAITLSLLFLILQDP